MTALGQIDGERIWMAPLAATLAGVRERVASGAAVLDALNDASRGQHNAKGRALRFVAQASLPSGVAYESFIYDTGQVPTRENLHDVFNALIWLRYPAIKRQLNAMQAAHIAAQGVGQVRGRVRDAITLFDENAAIVVVREGGQGQALIEALRGHEWQQVFCTQRERTLQQMAVFLFGHALLEKLCAPYKAITAHVWFVPVADDFFTASLAEQCRIIDATVATQLAACTLEPACFSPLPVLGVPGWWPDQDQAFYADTQVFRPRRLARIGDVPAKQSMAIAQGSSTC